MSVEVKWKRDARKGGVVKMLNRARRVDFVRRLEDGTKIWKLRMGMEEVVRFVWYASLRFYE